MTRQELLDRLGEDWDVVVVGGGITGAGVLRLAAGQGLKTLLLEQRDFAWGTSSRSGKMVHGGLRYLSQGKIKTTWQMVRERERLLAEYAGFIQPVVFAFPIPKHRPGSLFLMRFGLMAYDLMAGRRRHRYLRPQDLGRLVPGLDQDLMCGGFSLVDARTDDARLVLRVLQEAQDMGGLALNYIQVQDYLRDGGGRIRGVVAVNRESGGAVEIKARVVINAAGAWTDELRSKLNKPPRLRRLKGGHLVLPKNRLPLDPAVSLIHPRDGRIIYALPWEGATLVGTTDLDHDQSLDEEPRISAEEGQYLLEAVNYWLPGLGLGKTDVISTCSGVRPVVGTGREDPDREPRDHVVWAEQGLVTVTGGKLTTFVLVAREALNAARQWLGPGRVQPQVLFPKPKGGRTAPAVEAGLRARLSARYANRWVSIVEDQPAGSLRPIGPTEFVGAELSWAAGCEQVCHLDDLLLRRTRLGLLLPNGGEAEMEKIRAYSQGALGWDDRRWDEEAKRYMKLWREAYGPQLLH